jgi:hypothetical protein
MTQQPQSNFCPIFIVGNSRSGTTLMARILGNHPDIFKFEELHFFEELWNPTVTPVSLPSEKSLQLAARLLNIQRNGYLTQKNSLEEFREEAQTVIKSLPELISPPLVFKSFLNYECHRHHKTIPCDHTPRNVLYMEEILELYPSARIINMIRDPRDVLLSQKRRWRRPFLSLSHKLPRREAIRYWVNYHSITISKLWNVNIKAGDRYEEDRRIYSLKFEDLVRGPEMMVQQVCNFLSIDFEPSMLEVPQIGSSNQVDQPLSTGIDRHKAQGWKTGGLSETEIFICQKINQSLMEKHGYKLETIFPNPLLLMISLVSFPLKLGLALLFSWQRIQNPPETLRRRLK